MGFGNSKLKLNSEDILVQPNYDLILEQQDPDKDLYDEEKEKKIQEGLLSIVTEKNDKNQEGQMTCINVKDSKRIQKYVKSKIKKSNKKIKKKYQTQKIKKKYMIHLGLFILKNL